MNDLITRLGSILNLPKVAAISAPGLVFAIALYLLAVPTTEKPDSCLARLLKAPQLTTSKKPPTPPPNPLVLSLIPEECRPKASKAQEAEKKNGLDSETLSNEQKLKEVASCISALNASIKNKDADSVGLESRIRQIELDSDDFSKRAREYELQRNPSTQEFRVKAENARNAAAKNRKDKKKSDAESSLLAEERNRQLKLRDKLESAIETKASEDVAKPSYSLADGLFQSLTQTLISLFLLSITAGLLIEPINRSLINILCQSTFTQLFNWLFRRYVVAASTIRDAFTEARRGPEQAQNSITNENMILSPQFAIGKGLITREELGELENSYLRQADVSLGMIVPIVILWSAIAYRSSGACLTLNVQGLSSWWIYIGIPVLFIAGLERVHRFRYEVQQLIRGRWAKSLKEQEEVAKKVDQATQIAKSTLEALKTGSLALVEQSKSVKDQVASLKVATEDLEQTRRAISDRLVNIEQLIKQQNPK